MTARGDRDFGDRLTPAADQLGELPGADYPRHLRCVAVLGERHAQARSAGEPAGTVSNISTTLGKWVIAALHKRWT